MGVIDEVITVFKGMGYEVADRPQEKPNPRQVLVELDSMNLQVESQVSYRATTTLSIFFMASSATEVIEKTKKFMGAVEPAVHALSFKFNKPDFIIEGRVYYVALPCEYVEVIQV